MRHHLGIFKTEDVLSREEGEYSLREPALMGGHPAAGCLSHRVWPHLHTVEEKATRPGHRGGVAEPDNLIASLFRSDIPLDPVRFTRDIANDADSFAVAIPVDDQVAAGEGLRLELDDRFVCRERFLLVLTKFCQFRLKGRNFQLMLVLLPKRGG